MMISTPTLVDDQRTLVRQRYGVSGLGACDTAAEIMGDAACVRERLIQQHASMYAHDLEQARNARAQCEANNALNVPVNRRNCAAVYPDPPPSNYVTEWQSPVMAEKVFIPLKQAAGPHPESNPVNGAAMARPSFSFRNATGNNASNFSVGDRWELEIVGAPAGESVTVTGGKDGASTTTTMGTVDSSGRFALSGQITGDSVGKWVEFWQITGIGQVGYVEFKVQPTVDVTTRKPLVTPTQNYVPKPTVVETVPPASPWQTVTGLLSNPLVLLGGGALLLGGLAFSGSRR